MTAQERKLIAKARKVKRARDLLSSVLTAEYADDSIYLARDQLDLWISDLPAAVLAVINAEPA